jgi:hypothetical protein
VPQPGVPNNAGGVNGWQGLGTEEPYGQATKDAALKSGAPLAGAPLSSGPIAAPKRAGRQARRGAAPQPVQAPPAAPQQPQEDMPYDAKLAQWWQGIAAVPGASPLVREYAAMATQRLTGG